MSILIAALLAQGWAEPPPGPLYREAVACAASAFAAHGKKPGDEPGEEFEEVLTWGLVMAEFGRKAGRTSQQVDNDDLAEAQPFYEQLKAHKPKAFEAHRAYCKALLP